MTAQTAIRPDGTTAPVIDTDVVVNLRDSDLAKLQELASVVAERSALEAREKALKAELLALVPAEAPSGVVRYLLVAAGAIQAKVSFRSRTGINSKLLREAFPEAAQTCETNTTYRSLNL